VPTTSLHSGAVEPFRRSYKVLSKYLAAMTYAVDYRLIAFQHLAPKSTERAANSYAWSRKRVMVKLLVLFAEPCCQRTALRESLRTSLGSSDARQSLLFDAMSIDNVDAFEPSSEQSCAFWCSRRRYHQERILHVIQEARTVTTIMFASILVADSCTNINQG
jgi:hypothetical protein